MTIRNVVLGFSAFFISGQLSALSCAPGTLTTEVLKDAEIVFIGKVESVNPVKESKTEMATFQVVKPFKGVKNGQRLQVYRNVYWGDTSPVGSEYLVVPKKANGQYWTPNCKATQHYSHDEKSMKIVLEHFK